jgi:maltose alpha-D-glucosyltransferase/alpha-amylase
VEEAHRRGLRVITELVLNHTSDQHAWFQRSRRAPAGSPERDWYVWTDAPEKYKDARIIFKDFEHSNWSWDPLAKQYYWHRFYAHQPDLNWDNPAVKKAMMDAMDFWLGMGVDGLRLDAVPYLFEREHTSCENLPETHAALKDIRRHVDEKFKDRMLLAEANQWPEDAAAYFGQGRGDECHTAFHFPLMPRLFMSLQIEDRFPVVDILDQTPALPDSGQWVLFLRNHDELTLEMVTDEERDYMYRMYADDPQARINLGIRRRLAPLLGNNRRKIELLNGLLFSLPGTPVIYYGDEIGMGDNFYLGDRNGVRTPMQWSADRNAGFSPGNAQRLYLPVIIDPEYHYEAVNVDVQQNNPQSLLWWMKRMIALRRRSKVFGRGSLEMLPSENRKVLSFVRRLGDQTVLVVANLSRFVQHAELNLGSFAGFAPIEMMGGTEFPAITEHPYPLTLGPHGFYWFSLEKAGPAAETAAEGGLPTVVASSWEEALRPPRPLCEEALIAYIRRSGWAEGHVDVLRYLRLRAGFRLSEDSGAVLLSTEPGVEAAMFAVPLSFATGERVSEVKRLYPHAAIAQMTVGGKDGLLYDASVDRGFGTALLALAARRGRVHAAAGPFELAGSPAPSLAADTDPLAELSDAKSVPTLATGARALITTGRYAVTVFRRVESGVSPDLEMGRFLTDRARFEHAPALMGALELIEGRREPMTMGAIHAAMPHQGYAWDYTLDGLRSYFERVLTRGGAVPQIPTQSLLVLASSEIPPSAHESIGPYLRDAALLGQRVAQLHRALASDPDDPRFAPEPYTWHYQRSIYQTMRTLTKESSALLRRQMRQLSPAARAEAQRILELEDESVNRFREIHERRLSGSRIRVHGDLHLARVLHTGKDFLITGFEGDLRRSLAERRAKKSCLADVASMLRSYHLASYTALFGVDIGVLVRPEDLAALDGWARHWEIWVCAAFLRGYLGVAEGAPFLASSAEERQLILDTSLREVALRELINDLRYRPDWLLLSLKGLARLLVSVGS